MHCTILSIVTIFSTVKPEVSNCSVIRAVDWCPWCPGFESHPGLFWIVKKKLRHGWALVEPLIG